jgi:hypothetical protein
VVKKKPKSGFDVGARDPGGPASAPSDRTTGFLLAPKFFGSFSLSGPEGHGVRGAIEIGYRLPVLSRLFGLSLEPGFGGTWGSPPITGEGTATGQALLFGLPLLVSANVVLGPGLLRGLIGPSLDWTRLVSDTSARVVTDVLLGLGLHAGVGYGILLGPGALGLELRYRLSNIGVAGRAYASSALCVGVSYVFTP